MCIKMLHFNLRFDVRSRYQRFSVIYEQAGLTAQRQWVMARLTRIAC